MSSNDGRYFIIPYLLSLRQCVSDCQESFHHFPQVCLPMGDSWRRTSSTVLLAWSHDMLAEAGGV